MNDILLILYRDSYSYSDSMLISFIFNLGMHFC